MYNIRVVVQNSNTPILPRPYPSTVTAQRPGALTNVLSFSLLHLCALSILKCLAFQDLDMLPRLPDFVSGLYESLIGLSLSSLSIVHSLASCDNSGIVLNEAAVPIPAKESPAARASRVGSLRLPVRIRGGARSSAKESPSTAGTTVLRACWRRGGPTGEHATPTTGRLAGISFFDMRVRFQKGHLESS